MSSSLRDRAGGLAAALEGPLTDRSASEDSQDATLVRAARDGDRAAFGRLYERYARMVHGVLLARVPVSAVDDLVQEVFVRALRRMSALRKSESFGAWLAAIARNRANDYYRSVREEQLPEDASEAGIAGNATGADEQHQAATVLDAIRSLPDAYREPLTLRLVEGMTGPEIAARTGLTHGSVRVNLHRGMQQLRAVLNPGASTNDPEQETR